MDRRDEQGAGRRDLNEPDPPRAITTELIEAFLCLARGDFSVRVQRNFKRDTEDLLALFVNQIAEELGRLLAEREASRRALESGVAELSEAFLKLAAGDFEARATRSERGDPLDVLAFLLNNTAGEVGAIVGEARRQREVLEVTFESMLDGVLVVDDKGAVRQTNTSFARALGYERAALLGKRFNDLLAPSAQLATVRLIDQVAIGDVRGRELPFRTATGEMLSLSVNASGQRDATTGALIGIVLVARDDRELQKAQAQLQLSDRLATMGTLAAGVAHEINNPLSFVIGNLDFVAEEVDRARATVGVEELAEVSRALVAAKSGADRVRQIVRDLKAFSRVDEDESSRVPLARLLDAAAQMVRHEIRHRATLSKEYGPSPLVDANEARLIQVFLNLIQNAAQAIPAGAADTNRIVLVTGTTEDGQAFASVADTGGGIAEKDLSRIFDAFFTTKAVGVGTGLGLSISHRIVAGFGGTIDVSSEVGKGTTFRVVLPAAAERPAQAPTERRTRGSVRPPRRKNVLVVDDEIEVGRSIERILGRDHDVVTVSRGAAALELLPERSWDIVLCDLMMPEMTGIDVYRRAIALAPELGHRFVFLTGGTFDEASRAFLLAVPNGLLEKPFDTRDLRELVAQA
jgi:two-component system, NtrC family, sensor kinase